MMMRSIIATGALVLALVPACAGEAMPKPIAPKTVAPKVINHGAAITVADVGPAAVGYRDLKAYPGSEIKDGKTYAFARDVAASATYDGFEVKGAHLLIEGAVFSAALDVYTAKPVVLRGISVRPTAASPVSLLTRPGAGPVYALWSDFGGTDTGAVGTGLALRSNKVLVFRSRVSNTSDAVQISGSDSVVEASWLETRTAVTGDHNDTIQLLGAPSNIAIVRNKILNPNPQTSCLYLLGRNLEIRSNYLAGGGWTIYGGANNNGHGGGAASEVRVIDNVWGRDYFAKGGHFGPFSYWDNANHWSRNRFSDGTVISP